MSNTIKPPPTDDIRLTITETIPKFLRDNAQFVLFRPIPHNGKLLKLPFSPHDPYGPSIDPLNPSHSESFATIVAIYGQLDQSRFGLGVVLTTALHVTCFDLDAKDDAAAFSNAVEAMSVPAHATWGETSVSGNGRHYFYLGSTPDSTSSMNDVHPNIEIYCSKRFIALTGRVLPGALPDLTDGGGIVAHTFSLRAERRKERIAAAGTSPLSGVTYELGRGHMSNERALLLMSERKPLSYGHLWQAAPQGTGSERIMQVVGDLDKILADPEQVYQIIESSPLGQSRCNSLYRKFYKYWIPDARKSNDQGIWNRTQEEQAYLIERGREMALAFDVREKAEREEQAKAIAAYAATLDDEDQEDQTTDGDENPRMLVEWPPGVVGELAKEQMLMQHYPNQSIAVLWAVSTMSAIAQRSYHVNGSGLNTYIMLLASTGAGKERLQESRVGLIASLADRITGGSPLDFETYFGQGHYPSGPAMANTIRIRGRVSSLLNESSFLFESLADSKDHHAPALRREMLAIKTKSSRHGRMDGVNYADPTKSLPACYSPSLSLLCEGQPDRLYRALNPSMAEDGLLNRFEVFDVSKPKRGIRNRRTSQGFSNQLLEKLLPLVTSTMKVPDPKEVPSMIEAKVSASAQLRFDRYEAAVLDTLSERNIIEYQLLNRSLVTAMVYAAILAVADSPFRPEISDDHAKWALTTVYAERRALLDRFVTGNIGAGEDKRKLIVIRALKAYKKTRNSSINVSEAQHKAGIVRAHWLNQKISELGKIEFSGDKFLKKQALIDDALKVLMSEGAIEKVLKSKKYGDENVLADFDGEAYHIIDLTKYKD